MMLNDWLNYIHTTHDKTMDFRLERLIPLAKSLNLVPANYYIITVAGTNGKGTTAALISQILVNAGLNVGTFTSPHLFCYNERIKLNTKNIDDRSLCQAFNTVDVARKKNSAKVTEFEFGFLAALTVFKKTNIDIAVLEVGLGGRLDAVNIMDANLAIVTSIGLDHMDRLGNTLESIANEKAGIFRAQTPVVCGDPHPPSTLVTRANTLNCPVYIANQAFDYELGITDWQWHSKQHSLLALPKPNIPIENAATALMAIKLLPDSIQITRAHIAKALKNCVVPARLQQVQSAPEVILDVAHNEPAAQSLANALTAKKSPNGKTIAVFSCLKTKAIDRILLAMKNCVDLWCCAPLPVENALDAEALALHLDDFSHHLFNHIEDAYRRAAQVATKHDRIVVFGSFHVVTKVWPLIHPALTDYCSID